MFRKLETLDFVSENTNFESIIGDPYTFILISDTLTKNELSNIFHKCIENISTKSYQSISSCFRSNYDLKEYVLIFHSVNSSVLNIEGNGDFCVFQITPRSLIEINLQSEDSQYEISIHDKFFICDKKFGREILKHEQYFFSLFQRQFFSTIKDKFEKLRIRHDLNGKKYFYLRQ